MTTTPTLSPGVESKWPPGDNSCMVERWQEPTHLASAAPDNEQPHAAKHTNVRTSGRERFLEKQSGIHETEEVHYSGSKNEPGSSGADCWHLSCWKKRELIVRRGGKTGLFNPLLSALWPRLTPTLFHRSRGLIYQECVGSVSREKLRNVRKYQKKSQYF